MRTTVDIPDELLDRACRAANLRTRREAILAGLEELIRKSQREELRHLAGPVDLDIDRARRRGRRA
jgi:Arc/MetJ family transcription regulator